MKVQLYIGCTTRKGINLDQGAMFKRTAYILWKHGFSACSAHKGYGHWNGQYEECLIVSIIHTQPPVDAGQRMKQAVTKLLAAFDQEEILVLVTECSDVPCKNPSPQASGDDDYYPWLVVGTQASGDAPTKYFVLNALTGWETQGRYSSTEATQIARQMYTAQEKK